jgi:hypothetical protein
MIIILVTRYFIKLGLLLWRLVWPPRGPLTFIGKLWLLAKEIFIDVFFVLFGAIRLVWQGGGDH